MKSYKDNQTYICANTFTYHKAIHLNKEINCVLIWMATIGCIGEEIWASNLLLQTFAIYSANVGIPL